MHYLNVQWFWILFVSYELPGRTGEPADKQHIGTTHTQLHSLNDFLFLAQLDNLNLFKVCRFSPKARIKCLVFLLSVFINLA